MDQNANFTTRPRSTSHAFSLRSDKSAGNVPSSAEKAEKQRHDSFMRGESKANPNAAVEEAQPSTRNVLEKVTLESVRSLSVKDAQGNAIAEPDLSNPTRSRWERPLDTIRSFERAVDGDSYRRTGSRATSDHDRDAQGASQRNNSYGGNHGSRTNGHYGNRTEGHYDGAAPASRNRFSRSYNTEQNRHQNGHASQQYNYGNTSHEGSDSTGPWGNGTDPSSQNSSFERLHGIGGKRGQSPEQIYGMEHYTNSPINEEVDDYGYPARPPRKGANQYVQADAAPRQPISLGSPATASYQSQGGSLPTTSRSPQEKQKGWLSRRFSKTQNN